MISNLYLKKIFGKIKTIYLRRKLVEVGEYTYGKPKVIYYGGEGKIKIGKFCSIAQNVTLLFGGEHRTDWISTYPFYFFTNQWSLSKDIKDSVRYKGDIVIGNDVWIGYGATIYAGVTIGHGAVIAANSVVVKNVDPYTIVGGNPAKTIRKRFAEEEIKLLLETAWWDWPKDKINKNLSSICSPNIKQLKRISTRKII